jgi:tRNA uridine 5-carboxymethylaminomethyl modification enzyme
VDVRKGGNQIETTGYEEAAAQGIIAGINAALRAGGGGTPFIVDRAEAYLGVLIDDLVTRGVSEPYRMFTSRAEYRLLLRADNADQRLTPRGTAIGCVGAERAAHHAARQKRLTEGRAVLESLTVTPGELARQGLTGGRDGLRRSAWQLLSHDRVGLGNLIGIWPELAQIPVDIAAQLEYDAKYAVYVDRQQADIDAFRRDEALALPPDFDYRTVGSLSNEVREKLARVQPATLGQAARIPGITPAAITALLGHVRKNPVKRTA